MNGESGTQFALVTGASSGIGKAFAHEFARHGFGLLLVARHEPHLKAVAKDIAAVYGVPAHPIVADLSDPEAPEMIFSEIDKGGFAVTALVNNAGFGVPGMLIDVNWARHRDSIEVMMTAPVRLAYLLAPGMISRGRGWIINVSSLSAFLPPHAGGTLYYPVKSFLLNFSLAHGQELLPHGIHVTAVCPGFTETGFQAAAGGTVESLAMPRVLWLRAEDVAREGYAAVMKGDPISIPGRFNRLIALVFKLIPRSLGRWILRSRS